MQHKSCFPQLVCMHLTSPTVCRHANALESTLVLHLRLVKSYIIPLLQGTATREPLESHESATQRLRRGMTAATDVGTGHYASLTAATVSVFSRKVLDSLSG